MESNGIKWSALSPFEPPLGSTRARELRIISPQVLAVTLQNFMRQSVEAGTFGTFTEKPGGHRGVFLGHRSRSGGSGKSWGWPLIASFIYIYTLYFRWMDGLIDRYTFQEINIDVKTQPFVDKFLGKTMEFHGVS